MKILILFLALLISFPNYLATFTYADSGRTYYAKVENVGIYMYSAPVEDTAYRMFEIPSSYFVLLNGNENDKFYSAKYDDVQGFVLKDSVTPMLGTPQQAYATSSFRVFSQVGLPLYSSPTDTANYEITIPYEQVISKAYGKISGKELLSNSTDKWFYCSFTQSGKKYSGYLFSYYCDNVSIISENTEFFTEITEELDFSPINSSSTTLSDTGKVLIAFAVIIPCLIILYLMLKPKTKTKETPKRVPLRRPKRDYYEFNEDDLK